MKKTIYILVESYSDDDGNHSVEVVSIHNTQKEATKALADLHKKVKSYFNHPIDEYYRGHWYDINEEDDYDIRRVAQIEKKEINV